MFRIVLLTAILLLAAVVACPAQEGAAVGAAQGTCVGDQHQITIDIEFFAFDSASNLPVGVVFLRETIGACRAAEYVPGEPLPVAVPDPVPAAFSASITALFDVPEAGAMYRYTPYVVYDDGERLPTQWACSYDQRNWALAGCGEVPLVRGTVTTWDASSLEHWTVIVNPCPNGCWTEGVPIVLELVDLLEMTGVGLDQVFDTVFDFYGDRTYCHMGGGPSYTVTGAAPAPDGDCAPVPAEGANWGSLKASFR